MLAIRVCLPLRALSPHLRRTAQHELLPHRRNLATGSLAGHIGRFDPQGFPPSPLSGARPGPSSLFASSSCQPRSSLSPLSLVAFPKTFCSQAPLQGRAHPALSGGLSLSSKLAATVQAGSVLPAEKKQRLMTSAPASSPDALAAAGTGKRRIGTHNGTFHCDEALGCFMLRLTDKFKDADVIRTRNQEVLDTLDAVLDVGGVYDPDRNRFDHHQRGFDHAFGHGYTTKLSSAGLVYKHFGREVLAGIMGLPAEHKDVETAYLAVYKNFIEAVDAVDNGVNQYVSDSPPLYQSNTHLGARVGRLNPDWLDESTPETENAAFTRAMELTGSEFLESVNYVAKSWLPARTIVAECLEQAKGVHPTGEIIVLTRFCPWKQHLADLETDLKIPAEALPKYVVYEDDRGGQWRVQAVSEAPGSFASRLALLAAWRGLRDEELSRVSGIPGCVFVHISGFIGGNKTKEGALEMAKRSLAAQGS